MSEIHGYPSKEITINNYYQFFQRAALGQACVSTALQEETKFERKIMLGFSAMYYAIFKSEAAKQSKIYRSKPRIDVAKTLLNIVDS